jgi:hypothetical protein
MIRLTAQHKRRLRSASRECIEEYFESFSAYARSTRWLLKNNRYRIECISRFESDLIAHPSTLDAAQLVNYVSASAPAHAIDGWSYVSRAIDAALRGDSYSATHMGYYAELRAVMSLLAAEGVGIFSRWHAVVDETGAVAPFPRMPPASLGGGMGTHGVIWSILKHWAGLQRAADILDDTISPNGFSLTSWLEVGGANVVVPAIARRWLATWGMDLADIDEDHNLRNLASYRPSEFRKPGRVEVHRISLFVEELWRLFEPGGARRFPNLERYLLRRAWKKAGLPNPTTAEIQGLGLQPQDAALWSAFLAQADDPLLLELADRQAPIEEPDSHLRVISRAVLLLFVASSIVRRLLTNAVYTADDIQFWWQQHGETRGIWHAGAELEDPFDLWADIVVALDESQQWRAGNAAGTVSLRDWRRTDGSGFQGLTDFDIVGIWALLP